MCVLIYMQGAVELLLRVDDELTPDEADPLVLKLSVPVNISHNPTQIPISIIESDTYYDNNGRIFLAISFELECGEGFYGSDCGVFCIPRDNDLGHFTCDSNGNIMCLEGFNNTSTNCTQCLLSDGCCKCLYCMGSVPMGFVYVLVVHYC